jgi:hypothetical protein
MSDVVAPGRLQGLAKGCMPAPVTTVPRFDADARSLLTLIVRIRQDLRSTA